MLRVLPSQVVSEIDRRFPPLEFGQWASLHHSLANDIAAILALANTIPSENLAVDASDAAAFVGAMARAAQQLRTWESSANPLQFRLGSVTEGNPIKVIREVLLRCPDEVVAPATADLAFVTDGDLRTSIRLDISTATSAFRNREWKAATVLAGAALEALLLWRLQRNTELAVAKARDLKLTDRDKPIEEWALHSYISVADGLGAISKQTLEASLQAKSFRNLIHPGKSLRLGQECRLGTAHIALGALDFVVRDLSRSE